jgi:hypothetical protein
LKEDVAKFYVIDVVHCMYPWHPGLGCSRKKEMTHQINILQAFSAVIGGSLLQVIEAKVL